MEQDRFTEIGEVKITDITFRLKHVLLGDWEFQRYYRFQLLTLATVMTGSFLLGISVASLSMNFLPKPSFLVLQAVTVISLAMMVWKLQKEDRKLRRLDAMVHGLNNRYTTEKILEDENTTGNSL